MRRIRDLRKANNWEGGRERRETDGRRTFGEKTRKGEGKMPLVARM